VRACNIGSLSPKRGLSDSSRKYSRVELGLVLVIVALIGAMLLTVVTVSYLAVRGHLGEIPLPRSGAIALSTLVAAGLGAFWWTLGIFGFALGQILGNGNLGSLIGGLVGLTCWVITTIVYGARITRSLADIRVATGISQTTASPVVRGAWVRISLGVILLVIVAFVAGAVLAALNGNGP
jgi:hypothetical protein